MDDRNKRGDITNTVSKLMADREKRSQQEELAIENMGEYKKALNGVASTPNGQLMLKTLIKACGVFTVSKESDAISLIRHNERRNVYLQYVRPFLEPDVKKELEN